MCITNIIIAFNFKEKKAWTCAIVTLDLGKIWKKICRDTFQKKVSRNGYQTTRNGLNRREKVSWKWKFFWKNSENFCSKCPNGIIISEGPKHKFYNSEMECYEASIFFQARAENVCFGFKNKKKAKAKILRPWHAYL